MPCPEPSRCSEAEGLVHSFFVAGLLSGRVWIWFGFFHFVTSVHFTIQNAFLLDSPDVTKIVAELQSCICEHRSRGCVSKRENRDTEIRASSTTDPPPPLYLAGA